MTATGIISILDTILFGLAGLWGLIVLFKNASVAWKWIALAAIIWAITSVFILYLPSVANIKVLSVKIIPVTQRLGMGFSLFFGLLNYHR